MEGIGPNHHLWHYRDEFRALNVVKRLDPWIVFAKNVRGIKQRILAEKPSSGEGRPREREENALQVIKTVQLPLRRTQNKQVTYFAYYFLGRARISFTPRVHFQATATRSNVFRYILNFNAIALHT